MGDVRASLAAIVTLHSYSMLLAAGHCWCPASSEWPSPSGLQPRFCPIMPHWSTAFTCSAFTCPQNRHLHNDAQCLLFAGSLALVKTKEGDIVAKGFYDPTSALAFRVCAVKERRLDDQLLELRLHRALQLRQRLFDDETSGDHALQVGLRTVCISN